MDDFSEGLAFPAVCGRDVVVRFDGGDITSDAGLLLVAAADVRSGVTKALTEAASDRRQQAKVTHPLRVLLKERILAIAAGYPDANDLDALRSDPALMTACGHRPCGGSALGTQPTISRMENGFTRKDLMRMSISLAERVVRLLPADTRRVVIDIDGTDDPCHGQQELRLFNAYYGAPCYVPLYLHVTDECGRMWLMGALLRPGNAMSTRGAVWMVRKAVQLLRARFPDVNILVRGDSLFGINALMDWCEAEGVDYLLGLRSRTWLEQRAIPLMMEAAIKHRWVGEGAAVCSSFPYQPRRATHPRRLIARAQAARGELKVRFLITSLQGDPDELYARYCLRGDQENRIKEMKLDLNSGRTSCHRFLANQFRLLLHASACVLMSVLQEAAAGTRWAKAQVGTLRLRLLKVGARVVQTCRRIWFHLPSAFPDQDVWCAIHDKLLEPDLSMA